MLFDLIKNYGRRKVFDQHKEAFHNRFTNDQRKAIMISLLIVANSDDEFHHKEEDYYSKIAETLGYPLEENFVDEFFEMDRRQVFEVLNDLDDDQKEWYMLTLFSMIHVDGKPLDVEFEFARPYLLKMGIDQQQFEQAIQGSILWKKRPPKDFLVE